jgi:hypothetical protein
LEITKRVIDNFCCEHAFVSAMLVSCSFIHVGQNNSLFIAPFGF